VASVSKPCFSGPVRGGLGDRELQIRQMVSTSVPLSATVCEPESSSIASESGGRGSRRLVVDRLDVDRDRVGGLVEVDAAVGGAAVVLDLEGEVGVVIAVVVRARGELQLVIVDVGDRDELAGRDVDAVVAQGAVGCQRRDLDRGQRVGRVIVGVAEAKSAAASV